MRQTIIDGVNMRMRAKYVAVCHATAGDVAERWRSNYQKDGKWLQTAYGDSGAVYEKLVSLGPNPKLDAVADAIGNKSWSYLTCSGCNEYVEKTVAIGGNDYGDEPKAYCATCVAEANYVINEVKE